MSYIEVKQGEALYAEALIDQPTMIVEGVTTEQPPLRIGGTFIMQDGDIRLKLVRIDKFFHVDDEQTHLIARTEKNWTASLYDIVPGGSGQHGHTTMAVYYQTILVNTALVGWEEWKPEYCVRRSVFRVPGADYLLRHYPTYEGMANSELGKASTHEIIDVAVNGGRVRVYYSASGNMDSDYPKEVWPVVEFEFDEGLSLEEMRRRVITFMRFLSCAASQVLRTSEQIVSQLTHKEWRDEIHKRTNPLDFSVYYYEGRSHPEAKQARIHGSFVLMHDDDERAAFGACLTHWFARNAEWEGAASAMMDAFTLDDVMNPTRLLNATKWIEATPGTKSEQAMAEGDVLALSSLVSRQAIRLGYDKLLGRLKNSLRQITKEQNSARFARLVAELKATFGPQVVGDDLAAWVAEAFTLRGKVAHRPIMRQTDKEYEVFSKAVHAAQCFAYLMLIRDMPMTVEGKRRAASSSLVEGYRIGIKGEWPNDVKAKA